MLHATELVAVGLPPLAYLTWIRFLRSPEFRSSKMPILLLRGRRRYNLSMSAYSAAVATALWLQLARSQRFDSLENLLCRATPGVPAGWYLSKYAEFLDTGFLVASGRAVSLLHMKHHAVAGSVVALNLLGREGVPTPLFSVLSACNAFVHAWCATHTRTHGTHTHTHVHRQAPKHFVCSGCTPTMRTHARCVV